MVIDEDGVTFDDEDGVTLDDEDGVMLDDGDGATLDDDAALEDSERPEEDVKLEPGCGCCPVFVDGVKGFPNSNVNFRPQQLSFAALVPGTSLQQNDVAKAPLTSSQGIRLLKRCIAAFLAIKMSAEFTQDRKLTSHVHTIDTVLCAIRRLP